jgi:hypothetical protein
MVDPDSSQQRIDHAWERLQQRLHTRQPYLAVIQQLFTRPSDMEAPLLQRFYAVKPEARDLFAHFQRPI